MAEKRSDSSDREIVVTRVLDAPHERVFEAFEKPDQIGEWWGPRGFTTTTHEMDMRPGGVWRFVMHGPDGRHYQNRVNYIEVVKPERLVYSHGGEGDDESVNFHVTVTFEDHDGKTQLTMRSVFPSAEERDRVEREYGAVEGAHQTLARLAEKLAQN